MRQPLCDAKKKVSRLLIEEQTGTVRRGISTKQSEMKYESIKIRMVFTGGSYTFQSDGSRRVREWHRRVRSRFAADEN